MGAAKGLGLPPEATGTSARVPGKEGNPHEERPPAGRDVAPVSTAAAIFRGPRTNPRQVTTRVPLPTCSLPRPTECRRALPPGPSHCDRQRPLPCPTATPPRLPSRRGSTIGGGRGKDAQMQAPEQRGSAAEATRAPSHPERRGPGAQSPRYHTDLSGIRESRTNNPSEQTPAHQITPLLGGKAEVTEAACCPGGPLPRRT